MLIKKNDRLYGHVFPLKSLVAKAKEAERERKAGRIEYYGFRFTEVKRLTEMR